LEIVDNAANTSHYYSYYRGKTISMVPINYLAVILSAIAAMGLGFLWYGPLFGKQWIALMGFDPAEVAAKQAQGMKAMKMQMTIQAIGALLMAFVLAHSIVFAGAFLGATGLSAGLQAAIWSWLGFVAPVTIGTVLWDGKPWLLWMLNAGYFLVLLVVMGIILGLWV
jgi:hypothetical protein